MLARLIRLGLSSILEWVVGGYGRPVGAEGGAVDLSHFFHLHQKHPALPVAVAIHSFSFFPPSTAEVDGGDSRLCSHRSSCSVSFEMQRESVLGDCPVRLCITSSRISLNSSSIRFASLSILFTLRSHPSIY